MDHLPPVGRRGRLLSSRAISVVRVTSLRLLRMARRHDVAILLGAVTPAPPLPRRRPGPAGQDAAPFPAAPTGDRRADLGAEESDARRGDEAAARSCSRFPVKAVVRILDGPHVVYGVLSEDEVRTFPSIWGVDPERVVFTPYADDDGPGHGGERRRPRLLRRRQPPRLRHPRGRGPRHRRAGDHGLPLASAASGFSASRPRTWRRPSTRRRWRRPAWSSCRCSRRPAPPGSRPTSTRC